MSAAELIHQNAAWAGAAPKLSVLIPFLHDDPRPLFAAVASEARAIDGQAEIVALDDGGGDPELSERVRKALLDLPCPARLIRLEANQGRARARNRLAREARGGHLLFLDSDMLPDCPDFLRTYLELIARENPHVVFGGFSLRQAASSRELALHRALASRSDCLPASVRSQQPEKYVFTSNLLVRRDVFEAEAFDEGFHGWGWEDVEWGARVVRRFGVRHIDNTATHMGLDTAEALARKYEQSAANFARIAAGHPDIVRRYPSYRAARLLKRIPGRSVWRGLLKRAALNEQAPLIARVAAMKTYRAALYAEVV